MKQIELNCDMGEGAGNDEAIMPYIHAANIACGFHAGSGELMRRSIDLALKYNVHIGAHPSFRDKENFGRKEMQVPPDKLYAIVIEQLIRLDLIVREKGATLYHVKPHGALYNMAARDPKIARIVAQAVKDFREDLVLYGLSGSCLIGEARQIGLNTASEVFADRSYTDDGHLTPRSEPGALILDEEKSLQQAREMIGGSVTSLSGKVIPIVADTICIHGDGKNAAVFARNIYLALQKQNIARTIA